MKFIQVADDDPRAEWESYICTELDKEGRTVKLQVERIAPKEKSCRCGSNNAEIANDVIGYGFDSYPSIKWVARLLDAVDAKIARAIEKYDAESPEEK